jgi:hypothetical protein
MSMFHTLSLTTKGSSKKGVVIFKATGTNLQRTKMFIINPAVRFK